MQLSLNLVKRLLLAIASVAASAGLLYWVAGLQTISEAAGLLLRADPLLLLPSLLLMWVAFGFASERFRCVTEVMKISSGGRFAAFYLINLFTMFAAVVAPIGLAADVLRAGMLPLVLRASPWRSVSAVLQDKALGVIGVMAIGTPLLLLQLAFDVTPLYVAVQAAAFGAVVGITIGLQVAAPRLSPGRSLFRQFLGFLQDFSTQLSTAVRVLKQAGLAGGSILCVGLLLWCLGLAVGLSDGSALLMVSIAPAIYLAQAMPFTYAGWGAREAVAIFLLGELPGIELSNAVALSFAFGAVFTVASLPGALAPLLLASYRGRWLQHQETKEE